LDYANQCTLEYIRNALFCWIDVFKIDGIRLDNTLGIYRVGLSAAASLSTSPGQHGFVRPVYRCKARGWISLAMRLPFPSMDGCTTRSVRIGGRFITEGIDARAKKALTPFLHSFMLAYWRQVAAVSAQ